jgi:hypothetical protein
VTRTQAGRQGVQGALAAFVPIEPRTPKDFHRQYLRFLLQKYFHQNPERLRGAGAPDLAPSSLLLVIDAFDAGLLGTLRTVLRETLAKREVSAREWRLFLIAKLVFHMRNKHIFMHKR